MTDLELAKAEIKRLREAWQQFADAIGFPEDRAQFRHEVIALAKKLREQAERKNQP